MFFNPGIRQYSESYKRGAQGKKGCEQISRSQQASCRVPWSSLLGHVVEPSKTHAQNKFEHATQEIRLPVGSSDCVNERCTHPGKSLIGMIATFVKDANQEIGVPREEPTLAP